jgi:hypothetical protein
VFTSHEKASGCSYEINVTLIIGIVVFGRLGNDEHSAILTDMFNDAAGHVPQSYEIAEPLKVFSRTRNPSLAGSPLEDRSASSSSPSVGV